MEKISEKCKQYLKWANFTLGSETPRYCNILWSDAMFAFIYSAVSLVLIWIQGTDVVALGLNILCMFRAMLNNRLNEYKVVELSNIENNSIKYSHYHTEAIVICVAIIYSAVVWVVFMLNFIKAMSLSSSETIIIKIFTTIAILIVFASDLEDIIVEAFSATVCTY